VRTLIELGHKRGMIKILKLQ